ncbi:hypothetical protein [Antarcticibacterium arcticum]|uniref:hypothetical protein n=1 Tax=Antarcticibacterium arcticum TaxID=2585771 RepID=UPI001F110F84|nr:hypothetical protein [Antarcticibacterium arcticum]
MKKLFITVIAGLAMTFSQAQDITDAVRYSSENLSGTARFRAMGGAFGALGVTSRPLASTRRDRQYLIPVMLPYRSIITKERMRPDILMGSLPIKILM